ncbi:MAG TPA: deoxyribose-phosphate aldolase [Terriglobales bacterium]|jgi:deoxyribose-phosphate aldolase|nr:deoxyribose-phosphate aldolase [Terriglobales bacterium]
MSVPVSKPDWQIVARAIDHTVLKPEATPEQVKKLCIEAKQYGFAAVCVQPCYVELAALELKDTSVKVASVVGFPHGATLTSAKALEASETARLGAGEVDMVINVGQLKAGNRQYVEDDIRAVAEASHENGAILKVIIETCLLNREEKIAACQLSVAAGADFVKTSTGFSTSGATAEDVALMRGVVGPKVGVKAAGGVRTAADAIAMLNAGANRIGASASVAIVKELGAE